MPKPHRIIARVADDLYQSVMARSQELGCNVSDVIRDALSASLKPEIAACEPTKPRMWPAEIEPIVNHSRAIVDKDIRQDRRRLFGHLLAISVVCKERYPRTAGILEGHQSLLRLQHLFGYGGNV